jgi:hypothetical protein
MLNREGKMDKILGGFLTEIDKATTGPKKSVGERFRIADPAVKRLRSEN